MKMKKTWLHPLTGALKGALIGTGAILPGISGGVLAVVLGIYEPVMAFLAHPFRAFKENFVFFLPIVIGFALGVIALSRVVDFLFRASPEPMIWLFLGLIAGTLPALFKTAGREGRPPAAWIAFALSFVFLTALMFALRMAGTIDVTPNFWWWVLCGALWAIGLIVPGMSPSSIFIFLGLYQPMAAGIGSLSMPIILPMALGLTLTVAALAKLFERLLARAYGVAMHLILGLVLASSVGIIPLGNAQSAPLVNLLCFALGGAVALFMAHLGARLRPAD